MANFQAVERTNYVRFRPVMLALLTAYCAAFGIRLSERDGRHTLLPDGRGENTAFGDGCDDIGDELYELLRAHGLLQEVGLPLPGEPVDSDDPERIEPDLHLIATWMEPGEVLVVESAGHEKLHYVSAFATAFNHKGEAVGVDLRDVYDKAAEAFGVDVKTISHAAY